MFAEYIPNNHLGVCFSLPLKYVLIISIVIFYLQQNTIISPFYLLDVEKSSSREKGYSMFLARKTNSSFQVISWCTRNTSDMIKFQLRQPFVCFHKLTIALLTSGSSALVRQVHVKSGTVIPDQRRLLDKLSELASIIQLYMKSLFSDLDYRKYFLDCTMMSIPNY